MNHSPDRLAGGRPRRSFWAALLFLLALSSTAIAQPVETSPRPSTDWKVRYYSLARKIVSLEKAWEKYKIDSETAKTLLAELEASHQILQESLTASQMSAQRSVDLSASLQTRFDAISQKILEVEAAAQAAIRNAQITGYIIGATGVVLGILIAVLF